MEILRDKFLKAEGDGLGAGGGFDFVALKWELTLGIQGLYGVFHQVGGALDALETREQQCRFLTAPETEILTGDELS